MDEVTNCHDDEIPTGAPSWSPSRFGMGRRSSLKTQRGVTTDWTTNLRSPINAGQSITQERHRIYWDYSRRKRKAPRGQQERERGFRASWYVSLQFRFYLRLQVYNGLPPARLRAIRFLIVVRRRKPDRCPSLVRNGVRGDHRPCPRTALLTRLGEVLQSVERAPKRFRPYLLKLLTLSRCSMSSFGIGLFRPSYRA